MYLKYCSSFAPTPHHRAPVRAPDKRLWRMFLKSAAAVITLGLIVFLKLDRWTERWLNPEGSGESTAAPTPPPVPAVKSGPSRVVDSARTGSLFADRRAVVVRHSDQLKGSDDDLTAYLDDPTPGVSLILMASKPDRRQVASEHSTMNVAVSASN